MLSKSANHLIETELVAIPFPINTTLVHMVDEATHGASDRYQSSSAEVAQASVIAHLICAVTVPHIAPTVVAFPIYANLLTLLASPNTASVLKLVTSNHKSEPAIGVAKSMALPEYHPVLLPEKE